MSGPAVAYLPAPSLALTIPYPPSVNNLHADAIRYSHKQGKHVVRRVKTTSAREYAKWVGQRVLMAADADQRAELKSYQRFRLTLDLYPPADQRKHDADNSLKIVQDSICRAVGFDDSLIVELHVYKHQADRTNPRAEVRLEVLA